MTFAGQDLLWGEGLPVERVCLVANLGLHRPVVDEEGFAEELYGGGLHGGRGVWGLGCTFSTVARTASQQEHAYS